MQVMDEERYRLVVLGSPQVGKTAIIRRFLYKDFSERYKETVEDLHSRQFRIQGVPLPLDILDTNFHFPDMRRLAISTASAFLLVFAVDDVRSFKEMSDLWTEICQRRKDIALVPTVVVGNKCDQPGKKIYEATARAWTSRLAADVRYLEVSAKNDVGVTDIFRNLLDLSGFPRCKVARQWRKRVIDRYEQAEGGPLEERPPNGNGTDHTTTAAGESTPSSNGGRQSSGFPRRVQSTRATNGCSPRSTNGNTGNNGNGKMNGHHHDQVTDRHSSSGRVNCELKENGALAPGHPADDDGGRRSPAAQSSSLPLTTDLKRNRSFRVKKEDHSTANGGSSDEPQKLSRSSSLIRRTKHLSLKMRRHGEKPVETDDLECRIS